MDRRPIGVFDSGVGGLTVFKALEAALPGECFVYLGDTARVPYGTKSPETVSRYGIEAARFLKKQGVKLLVVACNTVSSVAMDEVAEEAHVPVIGVILPGARRAAKLSTGGRIGVIGTRATVASEAYPRAILALRSEAEVFSRPCPLFVPLAEEGWTDNDVARRVAETYLASLKEAEVDTVVLGCTHYPLLRDVIEEQAHALMGPAVKVVDSASAVAQEAHAFLNSRGLAKTDGKPGRLSLAVTDLPKSFSDVARRFLGEDAREVEQVDL